MVRTLVTRSEAVAWVRRHEPLASDSRILEILDEVGFEPMQVTDSRVVSSRFVAPERSYRSTAKPERRVTIRARTRDTLGAVGLVLGALGWLGASYFDHRGGWALFQWAFFGLPLLVVGALRLRSAARPPSLRITPNAIEADAAVARDELRCLRIVAESSTQIELHARRPFWQRWLKRGNLYVVCAEKRDGELVPLVGGLDRVTATASVLALEEALELAQLEPEPRVRVDAEPEEDDELAAELRDEVTPITRSE